MKFKIGDGVRIIKYGNLVKSNPASCGNCPQTGEYTDVQPDIIGKQAKVTRAEETEPPLYCLDLDEKKCFYDEIQLEKI